MGHKLHNLPLERTGSCRKLKYSIKIQIPPNCEGLMLGGLGVCVHRKRALSSYLYPPQQPFRPNKVHQLLWTENTWAQWQVEKQEEDNISGRNQIIKSSPRLSYWPIGWTSFIVIASLFPNMSPSLCVIIYSLAQPDFDPTPAPRPNINQMYIQGSQLDHFTELTVCVCGGGVRGPSGDERCAAGLLSCRDEGHPTLSVEKHPQKNGILMRRLKI